MEIQNLARTNFDISQGLIVASVVASFALAGVGCVGSVPTPVVSDGGSVDAGRPLDAGAYTGPTCDELASIFLGTGSSYFELNDRCSGVSDCTTRPLELVCPDTGTYLVACALGMHVSDVESYEDDLAKLTEIVCSAPFECLAEANCNEIFSTQCVNGACQNVLLVDGG